MPDQAIPRPRHLDQPQLPRRFLLQGFKEGDEVADLVGIEVELRHGRVSSDDTFRQCLLQRLDGIALMQSPEGWRDLKRAWAHFIDGVTPSTIGQGEALALARILSGRRQAAKQTRSDQNAASGELADQRHNRPLGG